jgi:hypothetical protein
LPLQKIHHHPFDTRLDEPQKGLDALANKNIAVNDGDTITVDELKENHGITVQRATTCCYHFYS